MSLAVGAHILISYMVPVFKEAVEITSTTAVATFAKNATSFFAKVLEQVVRGGAIKLASRAFVVVVGVSHVLIECRE